MKRIVCYIIGVAEFVRLIIREYLLFIIGERPVKMANHNISWIISGGGEFEYMIEKYKDIPCEVTFSYIGHAHKCIYEMED